jgi:hypothetical protein
MRLVHDGQLAGLSRRTPVQFARYWPETPNAQLTAFYDSLLAALPKTAIGCGDVQFRNTEVPSCFAIQWQEQAGAKTLVLVNMAQTRAAFSLQEGGIPWAATSVFSDPESNWTPAPGGLQVTLSACGYQVLELRRQ